MYRLSDYREMILDPVRTPAYVRAIRSAVRRGDSVIELGTGFGYFAVLACRAGAARVHAIEPDPVVHLGPELARANACEGRIEFVQNVSTNVTVEPADVLISDLRGTLPLLGAHLPAVIDARRRLLKPGGIQIPRRDTIFVALATDPTPAPPGRNAGGLDLAPVDHAMANLWGSRRLEAADLVSAGVPWRAVDYATVSSPDLDGRIELVAERDARVDGLGVWFDTELHDGHGFSNAPGSPPTVYGHAFFPLPAALALRRGEVVQLRLRAALVGEEYAWSWEGMVAGAGASRAFSQSTFRAAPLSAERLRRRTDRYVARLGRAGRARAWILTRMAESAPLGEIARGAAADFPDVFGDFAQALRCVADLSEQLCE